MPRSSRRSSPRSKRSLPTACCSRITTSPTAGCSQRLPRWRSRRAAASTSTSTASRGDPLGAAVRRGARRGRRRSVPLDRAAVLAQLDAAGLAVHRESARLQPASRIRIRTDGASVLDESRIELHRAWSATTHEMQRLRDDPDVVDEEYDRILDAARSGPLAGADVRPGDDIAAPFIATRRAPAVAILREQGVNGQVEMAAAFDRAGFDAVDVHMTDIIAGAPIARRLPRLRRVRRLLVRRRARRRRGLGEVDPLQRARPRRVRRVLRPARHVRARRVQRLPDDEQPVAS